MEAISRATASPRWILITALAPISWGATYVITRQLLPAESPLWGSALRALPAGLLLLMIARRLPRGSWWWRSLVLGTLNFGAFFLLVYLAAQLLPSSVAASIMALAPLALAGSGWLLLGQRPTARILAGALLGITGVTLVVGLATSALNGWGIAASLTALVLSSVGAILTQRWRSKAPLTTPLIAMTSWQLIAGGVLLLIAAVVVEGPPPAYDTVEIVALVVVAVVATAIAFVCWFAGLAHLPAGTVGVIGLLNPVTGVVLGTLVANETLSVAQVGGVALVLAGILVAQQRAAPKGSAPGG